VGIWIGERADYVIVSRNIFSTSLKRAVEYLSTGGHNTLQHPSGN
jgi:hypothetical protein